MSCKECEVAEEQGIAYYRWDTANIGMIGCRKHLREIFEVLSAAQVKQRENEAVREGTDG